MSIKASAIFCDDIRIEQSGKLILIGVYSGAINVRDVTEVELNCLVQMSGVSKGNHSLRVLCSLVDADGDKNTILNGVAELEVEEGADSGNFPIPPIRIPTERSGQVVVLEVGVDDDELSEIATLQVRVHQPEV